MKRMERKYDEEQSKIKDAAGRREIGIEFW